MNNYIHKECIIPTMTSYDKVVDALWDINENHQSTTLILGDHDCDGLTSTSIMSLFLPDAKVKVTNYERGHGWNTEEILNWISEYSLSSVIILDSGIERIDYNKIAHNLKHFIIIDHHKWKKPEDLNSNIFIINPQHEELPFKEFCTAMLTYSVTDTEDYQASVLACIGTIGDVQTYDYDNWVLLRRIIRDMEFNMFGIMVTNNFFATLKDMYKGASPLEKLTNFSTYINSMSRLGYQQEAIKFCISESPVNPPAKSYYERRKELLTKTIIETTFESPQLDVIKIYNIPKAFLSYIATRECNARKKCILAYFDDNSKGSARGYKEINIMDTLQATGLIECKGHESACGFFVKNNKAIEEVIHSDLPFLYKSEQEEVIVLKRYILLENFDIQDIEVQKDITPLQFIYKTSNLDFTYYKRYKLSNKFFKHTGFPLDIFSFSDNLPEYVTLQKDYYNNKFIFKEVTI